MFRFSIRDLLWLVVVVALAVGWSADRSRRIAAVEREREFWENLADTLQSFIESEGHKVELGDEIGYYVFYNGGDRAWTSNLHTGLKALRAENPQKFERFRVLDTSPASP